MHQVFQCLLYLLRFILEKFPHTGIGVPDIARLIHKILVLVFKEGYGQLTLAQRSDGTHSAILIIHGHMICSYKYTGRRHG